MISWHVINFVVVIGIIIFFIVISPQGPILTTMYEWLLQKAGANTCASASDTCKTVPCEDWGTTAMRHYHDLQGRVNKSQQRLTSSWVAEDEANSYKGCYRNAGTCCLCFTCGGASLMHGGCKSTASQPCLGTKRTQNSMSAMCRNMYIWLWVKASAWWEVIWHQTIPWLWTFGCLTWTVDSMIPRIHLLKLQTLWVWRDQTLWGEQVRPTNWLTFCVVSQRWCFFCHNVLLATFILLENICKVHFATLSSCSRMSRWVCWSNSSCFRWHESSWISHNHPPTYSLVHCTTSQTYKSHNDHQASLHSKLAAGLVTWTWSYRQIYGQGWISRRVAIWQIYTSAHIPYSGCDK